MTNTELSPKYAAPIEAPEVAAEQLPLDEVQAESPGLDSGKLDVSKLGAQLEATGEWVAKKGDSITARARRDATSGLGLLIASASSSSEIISGVINHGSSLTAAGMLTGVSIAALSRLLNDRKSIRNTVPVQIPESYSIQCLRANETSPVFRNHQVIAFVHPRQYEEGKRQTTEQARNRLRDALRVIEQAPAVASVVLPASALREARLPYHSSKLYTETILDLKPDAHVRSPYKDSEASVVLNSKEVEQLLEALEDPESYSILHRAVDAVAERFPLARLQLTEAADDNKRLVPLLHTLLRRTLDGELLGARRERGHDGELYYDRKESLITQIDIANKFDPLIVQRRATDSALVETQRLSQMTGDDERLMADIVDRLELRSYSDLELVSVTLRLAGQRQEGSIGMPPDSTQALEANAPISMDPVVLSMGSESRPARNRFRRRMVGRVAAAALLGSLLVQSFAVGEDLAGGGSRLPGIVDEADVVWRIDAYGMPSSGYYTQVAYDHFNASTVQWSGRDTPGAAESLPAVLPDPTERHLTVSGVTNSSEVDVPVLWGTKVGAISAKTKEGLSIQLNVYRRNDNTLMVHVENGGAMYKLSYELISDEQLEQMPFADRTLKVTDRNWDDVDLSSFPDARQTNVYDAAGHIASQFTYDASTRLFDKLASAHTTNDYLHVVYGGRRCDCIECATAAALSVESVSPNQSLLLGNGYFVDDGSSIGHNYLVSSKAHAWLIDARGLIIDATARNTDENSNLPKHESTAALDARTQDGGWSAASKVANDMAAAAATAANQEKRKQQRRSLEDFSLALLSALGAAGVWNEVRTRTVTNGVLTLLRKGQWSASTASVHPGKVVSAMAWHAYGDTKSPMPTYDPSHTVPLIDNIPTSTLEAIADGDLRTRSQFTRREWRSAQRMAKLLLAERRRDNRHASRKK